VTEPAVQRSRVARLVADDEARFRDVNAAASTLLGYPKARLLELSVWDITPQPQREAARRAWRQFIGLGHQAGEYQVETADGLVVPVQFEAVANFRPGLHLSLLRPLARGRSASRPLDECPYDRPYPVGFDLCPHYREAMSGKLLLHGREVAPVRSCAHLAAGHLGQRSGGFYGRCALGDAVARSRLSQDSATN
jgi:PAS domain S-box-containing protein